MYLRRGLATGAAALLLIGISTAAAADDSEYVHEGSYTVPYGDVFEGDLTVRNGTLTISGIVEGEVRQLGPGAVNVTRSGEVWGNITESSSGGVRVFGRVGFNIYETGTGSVIIHSSGQVDGEITEAGSAGNIDIRSEVRGNVTESGDGHVYLRPAAEVGGNVREGNSGNLYVYRGSQVGGSVSEHGPGSLIPR